jgi:hypothetical protein
MVVLVGGETEPYPSFPQPESAAGVSEVHWYVACLELIRPCTKQLHSCGDQREQRITTPKKLWR